MRTLNGNVTARVSSTHDKHPFITQHMSGCLVMARVNYLSVEIRRDGLEDDNPNYAHWRR